MLRRLVVLALVLLGLVAGAAPALAGSDGPVTCPPGSAPDPVSQTCVIVVTDPGQAPRPGGGGGGGNGSTAPAACTFTLVSPTKRVPCSSADGWWVQSQQCYAKAASPQPPLSDPVWAGHADGQIYDCYRPINGTMAVGITFQIWLPRPPAGAPPDPRVLARQAVAAMNLRAVSIGIVPEDAPGRVGLVGMPVWLWAAAPGPQTMGPITRSASAGGYTVTATARVARVVWSMGDGGSVTCTGPGTPYADRYGTASSPTCGYRYDRQGRFTVTATSDWVVAWSGLGQSGTIPVQLRDSTTVTIGEAQVLRR